MATESRSDAICSEATLTRSLGYGTYRFVVRDVSHIDPSNVFSIFTFDYSDPETKRVLTLMLAEDY